MKDTAKLHRALAGELSRLELDREHSPSLTAWRELLDVLSTAYAAADDEHDTLRRSIDVSSGEMRGLREVLGQQVMLDALTGLPNRAALIRHLDQALSTSARVGRGLAILYVDLDGFKQVNDSLGYAVGDELLVLAGQRIRVCLRQGDFVARLGGDEFVVVCQNGSDSVGTPAIADRIGSQLGAPFPIGEHHAVVSASIGLATTADSTATSEDLLRQADLAMYQAKLRGKARTAVFDESMQLVVDTKFSVRNALGRAINHQELRVLYQPVVSLADERVIGAEALVRWERPGSGLLSPDEFIPIAEASSLISAVDCWVLQEACRTSAQWCEQGATIAVNLSARTLEHDDVVNALSEALRRTGISPQHLALEVTETALLSGNGTANRNLGRMRDLGVKLSIDDFGTGYSSLSHLQRTDIDVLKIDRSFVSLIDVDASSATIVSSIIAMGHALGMTLIAEGVERPSQAALLREQGCDAAQGWLFGRPLVASEFDEVFGEFAVHKPAADSTGP